MQVQEHSFFKRFEPEQAAGLMDQTEITVLEPSSVIFEEGSDSDRLFMVLEGEVMFCKKMPDGKYRTISRSVEGDFFGEIGIFTGEPRSLRAEACTRVKIATIKRDPLFDVIKNASGPLDQILQSIINHLHETTRHYVEDMLHQEKMALVGGMMNTIIHDFKNPFCLISLAAQLISQKHGDEKTQQLCRNIEEQIQRMVAMAEEINMFSRGEQNLHLSHVSLSDLIEKFQELNQPFFEHGSVDIEINVPEVTILAEKNKLIRVLQNLVGNAIEAMTDSGGKVEVNGEVNGDRLSLTIIDNGSGIPQGIRRNFWAPFVTYGKSKGTGLGTAIAKSIIEAHGGTIRFETETGVGTTFFIELPLESQVRTESPAISEAISS